MEHQHPMSSRAVQSPGLISLSAADATAAGSSRTNVETLRHEPYHGHIMCKNVMPQLQQTATFVSRPPVPLAPHAIARSLPQNEVKQCPPGVSLIRSQTVPHSVMPNHPLIPPTRFMSGSRGFHPLQAAPMTNVTTASPGRAQQIPHIISTPSPRPSILRKRGETGSAPGGSAKRRLPFMKEAPTPPTNPVQMATNYSAGPTPPTLPQSLLPNAECSNVNTEESPRKRMRKQQFETDAIPDQIKMAIDVIQPVALGSEMWRLGDHSRLMDSFALMGIGEKKKRGRPRANSRPATVQPIELHQSVSVFVDIDSPKEGQANSLAGEQTCYRGTAASVPPVHLEGSKNELSGESSKSRGTLAKNDTKHHGNVSKEECISLLNFWQREKNKFSSSGPEARHLERPCAGNDSSASPKVGLVLDEKEADDAVEVLMSCLKETRKERHFKQQLSGLVPVASDTNTFFALNSTSASRSRHFCCQNPRFHNCTAADVDPSVNHFESLDEFENLYGTYRKLKQLHRRESRLLSSTCTEKAAQRFLELCEEHVKSNGSVDTEHLKSVTSARARLISQIENLSRKQLNPKGRPTIANARLPVAKCSDFSILRAPPKASLAKHEVASWSDEENDLKEVEELIDEIISFIARDESPCTTSECVERSFIRESIGGAVKAQSGHKEAERALLSRRSRARMLLEESFHSVLKKAGSVYDEDDLGYNVSTFSPTRCKRLSTTSRQKSAALPPVSNCSSLRSSDESAVRKNTLSFNEELWIRVHHVERHLGEQLNFEESVLGTFEHLNGLYKSGVCWGMQHDAEHCDLKTMPSDARIRSLREMLAVPPCKLAPDRKLDFGDQCGSVISCPDECEMNKLMMGISPFWAGSMKKANGKNCSCTRAEGTMRDRSTPSFTLREDHKEYYLEDLIDHRQPEKFRMDYYRMEKIWSQLKKLDISGKSSPKNRPSRGRCVSRRNAALFRKEQFVTSESMEEAEIPKNGGHMKFGEKEDISSEGFSAHEIFATAFKAIHQTTMIMIQTRNAILELVHNILEESDDDDDEQNEYADDEEEFSRQMEHAVQESFQELQSSSKA